MVRRQSRGLKRSGRGCSSPCAGRKPLFGSMRRPRRVTAPATHRISLRAGDVADESRRAGRACPPISNAGSGGSDEGMNSSRRLRFPAADQSRCIDAAASFKKLPNRTGKFPAARTCGGVEADDGVRTRDPQLGKPVKRRVVGRQRRSVSGIATAGNRSKPLGEGDDWRATGARAGQAQYGLQRWAVRPMCAA